MNENIDISDEVKKDNLDFTSRKITRDNDLVEDYQNVFNSEKGQIVLYDLMKRGYFLTPTSDDRGDSHSHRNEGMREIILYILEMLEKDSKEILEIYKTESKRDEEYFNEN